MQIHGQKRSYLFVFTINCLNSTYSGRQKPFISLECRPSLHTHTHTHPKESLWMVLCVVSADDTVRAVPIQPWPSPWLACPQHFLLSSMLCLASSPHCSWRACSPGASDPLLALRPSCSSRHSQAGCLRGLCSDVTLSVSHP